MKDDVRLGLTFMGFIAICLIIAISLPTPSMVEEPDVSFNISDIDCSALAIFTITHFSIETPGSMVTLQDYYRIREIPENGAIEFEQITDTTIINYWSKTDDGVYHLLKSEAYQN